MASHNTHKHLLLIIDPDSLFPASTLAEIEASNALTLNKRRGVLPSAVILVSSGEEMPSRTIMRNATALATLPVLIYDAEPSVTRQANALQSGAGGYLIEGFTASELVPIIEIALCGGYGVSQLALELLRSCLRAPMGFSRRERDAITLMALGADNNVIAAELKMTVSEVESCLQGARTKIGVDTNTALATWWTHWTLSEDFDDFGSTTMGEDHAYVLSA